MLSPTVRGADGDIFPNLGRLFKAQHWHVRFLQSRDLRFAVCEDDEATMEELEHLGVLRQLGGRWLTKPWAVERLDRAAGPALRRSVDGMRRDWKPTREGERQGAL